MVGVAVRFAWPNQPDADLISAMALWALFMSPLFFALLYLTHAIRYRLQHTFTQAQASAKLSGITALTENNNLNSTLVPEYSTSFIDRSSLLDVTCVSNLSDTDTMFSIPDMHLLTDPPSVGAEKVTVV